MSQKPVREVAAFEMSDLSALATSSMPRDKASALYALRTQLGLTPLQWATLKSATNTDALMPLLGLLEAPEGPGPLERIVELLEQVAESQVRLEQRLGAVERMMLATSGISDG